MATQQDAVKRELENLRKRRKTGKAPAQNVRSNIDVERLKLQLARDTARAEALGAKKSGGPSIIGRVFDVLSRGQYLTAGAVQGALKKGGRGGVLGSLQDAGTGALKGLEGKRKTSYSQILAEHGVKNKWVAGGVGLVGDIALDPTTYIGTGLIKGATKGTHTALSAKAVDNALKAAKDAGEFEKVASAATKAYKGEKLLKGTGGLAEKTLTSEAKKVGKEAAQQLRERIAADVSSNLPERELGKLTLKVGGKQVGETEKVHQLSRFLAEKAGATKAGQGAKEFTEPLAKLFSTSKLYGPLAPAKRLFQGRSIAEYDDWVKHKGWQTLKISDEDAKIVTHAVESGAIDDLSEKLRPIAEQAKKDFEEIRSQDLHAFTEHPDSPMGLVKPDSPTLENYMYHSFKNDDSPGIKAFKAARAKAIKAGEKPPTLKDAVAKGLKPEEDIRVIMMDRAAKSFSGTARGNSILDASKRFGMTLDKKTLDTMQSQGHDLVNLKKHIGGQDLPYLGDNVYMDRKIADNLKAMDKVYRTPKEIEKYKNLFDNVQNKLKAGQTVYNPGHHARNFMTDTFLSFLDGVRSPVPYDKARKLLWGGDKAITESTKIGKSLVRNTDLLREFRESGASPGWMITHVDEGSKLLKGKVSTKLHRFAGKREEYGRLSHWIDALEKESKGLDLSKLENLKAASERAGNRVRHWHVDYTDLTPFERTFMKRVVPYYTWQRHATPLMIEAMLTRPGKVAAIPKGISALETLLGIPPQDKLPVDMIPKWLREAGAFQVGSSGENPVMMAPFLPTHDTAGLLEGGTNAIIGNLASQTSPFIRAPFELGMKRTLYGGGIPIKSNTDYLLNQLPAARNLSSIKANAGDPNKEDARTRLLNYLTGAGLYEQTPNRLKGELHRQLDQRQAYLRKARGK